MIEFFERNSFDLKCLFSVSRSFGGIWKFEFLLNSNSIIAKSARSKFYFFF